VPYPAPSRSRASTTRETNANAPIRADRRARPAGAVLFVEVEIKVNRILSLDQVGAIRERIITELVREMPEAEVTVDAQPLMLDNETIYERVLLIAGDGAFGLNGMEMETAVRFKLPMTVVIGNDGGWGQIRNPQLSFFGAERQVATSLPFTRFDQMVEALGGKGVQVTDPKQLRPALERAMGSGEVYCINVVLDPGAYRRGGQVSMAI